MFGWKKIKPSLFYKYFFSYMAIFLIPFVIISAIFYYNSVSSLRNEIVQSNIKKMEQVRNMTDLRMKELEKIAARISYDARLTPYMVSQPYSGKQAIDELKRYKANSAIIDELLLYYRGKDHVYSPRGVGSLNTLVKDAYPFTEEHFFEFKEDLIAVTNPTIRPVDFVTEEKDVHQRLIAYLYPIPSNSSTAHGSVVFFVKEQMLTNLIEDILGDLKGNVYIFNDQNDILTENNNGISLSSEKISELALSHSGVGNKKMNDQDYSVVTVQSDVNGWTFVTAIPTAQFYAKVGDFRSFVLIILTIIALVGLGGATFLAFKQYKPIHHLSQYLRSRQYRSVPEYPKKDDFATIRDKIEMMLDDSEQLRERVNVQQPFVRDQCLTQLLKGNVNDQQKMKTLLNDLQMTMDGKYFFVATYTFSEDQFAQKSLENRENILQILTTNILFQEGVAFGLELIQDNAVAIIVNLHDVNNDPRIYQNNFAKMLLQQLKDYDQTASAVGIGTVYEGMGYINRSFIEARAAIEYSLVNQREQVIYFDDITTKEGEAFWYPADERLKFIQSLKQGDHDVAHDSLRVIMRSLRAKEPSIYLLRCMCFDIINTVLKTALELGLDHYAHDIRTLVEFRSTEELEKNIQRLVINICNEVEQNKESHNNDLRDGLLDYIGDHYKMHDLSLNKIAEIFQVSVSYLSRFIKEQTGTNFTELVWQLRVEDAKRQLQESDRPIKDIVADLGYVDVANFTRRFREHEGTTPGQFRKQAVYEEQSLGM